MVLLKVRENVKLTSEPVGAFVMFVADAHPHVQLTVGGTNFSLLAETGNDSNFAQSPFLG